MGKNFKSPKNDLFIHYIGKELTINIFRLDKDNVLSSFSHAHSEYEFLIPITPIPYLIVNRTLYYGECGKVYPIPSLVEHGTNDKLSNVAYLSILISKDFFEENMKKIGYNGNGLYLAEFDFTPKLNNLMKMFKDEVTAIQSSSECIHHIASLIAMELLNRMDKRCNNHIQTACQYLKTIKETADYIIENVNREISIDELASLCNISRFHYIRTFKKCFGDTPYKYLMKVRLSIAKLLLENTNLPITEISSKSGFFTPNRFSEVFKQKVKLTPTEYRRIYNKNFNPSIKTP